jgi:DNA-binding NtrC family response regulator
MSAGSVEEARRLAGSFSLDFVLLDVHLPDGRGTDLLADGTLRAPTRVIVMTAQGAIAGAVEAMRAGALDYLVKPFDPSALLLAMQRARRTRQSAREMEHRRSGESESTRFFGESLAPLRAELDKLVAADRRLQGRRPSILITGETGTGKTSVARWLHARGPRAAGPLVEVNCSALPESLAESELFVHERGAFTDARTSRLGLFEAADGGTLFLDELPSLSPALQAKVLTVLEDQQIRRLGGTRSITVDVRRMAATNRDLRRAVSEGEFREDLYHRLDLYRVHLPPLRELGEDIPRLAEHLLARLCRRHRLPPRRLTGVGRQRLVAHAWPGNVRELAHELERALGFSECAELDFEHLGAGEPAAKEGESASADWLRPGFTLPVEGFLLARRASDQYRPSTS